MIERGVYGFGFRNLGFDGSGVQGFRIPGLSVWEWAFKAEHWGLGITSLGLEAKPEIGLFRFRFGFGLRNVALVMLPSEVHPTASSAKLYTLNLPEHP